jgi:hypothetical protein
LSPGQEVLIIRVPTLWSLRADHQALAETSTGWQAGAQALHSAAAHLHQALLQAAPWRGLDAQAARDRLQQRHDDLAEAATLATRVAAGLDLLADTTTAAQRQLDAEFGRLTSTMGHHLGGDTVVFAATSTEQARQVRHAVGTAALLRADLTRRLNHGVEELAALAPSWRDLAEAGRMAADITPPQPDRVVVLRADDLVLVSTGAADDQVRVRIDPDTGHTQVLVAGQVAVSDLGGSELVLRTGDGADTVVVQATVTAGVTVLGGAGDDVLSGGSGDDHLYGSSGHDTLLGGGGDDIGDGGAERDYLDGGDGADTLDGGDGADTLYGLGGTDHLSGGAGRDYLFGGRGDDILLGGAGDDVLADSHGASALLGGSGLDRGYTQADPPGARPRPGEQHQVELRYAAPAQPADAAPQADGAAIQADGAAIQIDGTAQFAARLEADLDLLRASPTGRQLLTELDRGLAAGDGWRPGDGPDTLTIRELALGGANGYAQTDGEQHIVGYEPTYDTLTDTAPPVVVLYHELAHSYDQLHGYEFPGSHTDRDVIWSDGRWMDAPNLERVAVGLPFDADGDPTTPDRLDPRHPFPLTENGLRAELGEPLRLAYGVSMQP